MNTTTELSLDGKWQFLNTPDPQSAVCGGDALPWETIEVPSYVSAQHRAGFCGTCLYRRRIFVTPQMAASRTVLRMEGVNGFADVYVNGRRIGGHRNAFVTWRAELTEAIRGLSEFILSVTVDENTDTVSTFNHGGILHSVFLELHPSSYLAALKMDAAPNAEDRDGTLRFTVSVSSPQREALTLRTALFTPSGAPVPEGSGTFPVSDGEHSFSLSIPAPILWDAEHPRLYTADFSLFCGDALLERTEKSLGFRRIERKGNRLFVNGREVKLRGACRHEVTALNGRCLTRALIEEDVRLFKEANCNYIRTSHYPPSEYFLELCDRYGIYVEDELALAFIARTLPYTQQDPSQTERYLSHFAELYARDASHPCVLIWSLCNESFGGLNFDLLNRFAKETDPTRVTKFSYPMTIREEYLPVDIWSVHYANYESDPAEERDNVSVGGAYGTDGRIGKSRPVLHDEYVHVPCYNRTEQRRDPGVREYWGESLAFFWDKIWHTEGALGGAIWAGIDETDIYVGGRTCLEWGIIDIWRRRKPEHCGTRKAYAPVLLYGADPLTDRIARENGTFPGGIEKTEDALLLRAENRFCHTSLSETRVKGWYFSAADLGLRAADDCERAKPAALSSFSLCGPDVSPFGRGELAVPLNKDADFLYLTWHDADGARVNEFLIPLRQEPETGNLSAPAAAPALTETADTLTVRAGGLALVFSRADGQLLSLSLDGREVLTGGPRLHVPYLTLPPWSLSFLETRTENGTVSVRAAGSYGGAVDATFTWSIAPDASVSLCWRVDGVHVPMPSMQKMRVGVDCGGLDELGVTLTAAPGYDTLDWERTGKYSAAPEDFIGRNAGRAHLNTEEGAFGTAPAHPWKDDARHDILNGPFDPGLSGTNDFCSMKADLRRAVLLASDGARPALTVRSDDTLHLRAEAVVSEKDVIGCRDPRIAYSGTWYPQKDRTWLSTGQEMWSNEKGARADVRFTGTGIVWFAPVDVNYGLARVYVDGILKEPVINQRVDGVDFPSSAPGFDKKYRYPVYSVSGLPMGEHTLTIEVCGEHAPDSCDSYIVLEQFVVLSPGLWRPVELHLLTDYGYPHIAWGNKARPPIILKKGDGGTVTLSV